MTKAWIILKHFRIETDNLDLIFCVCVVVAGVFCMAFLEFCSLAGWCYSLCFVLLVIHSACLKLRIVCGWELNYTHQQIMQSEYWLGEFTESGVAMSALNLEQMTKIEQKKSPQQNADSTYYSYLCRNEIKSNRWSFWYECIIIQYVIFTFL